MHRSSADADQAISVLAADQDGRVAHRQLVRVGVSDDQIAHRIAAGRLHRLQRGVYAAGHPGETNQTRLRGALLAVGDDGLISHLAAAGAYEIAPHPLVIDLTSPRKLRSRDGIRSHRRLIHPDEIRHLDGIPLTSPSQTIFDLATMLGTPALARTANQAFVKRLFTIDGLRICGERNRGRKGATAFARLLDLLDPEGRPIRSPLEARLNAFLRARGFPPWESNVRLRVGGETIEADVLWREQRVIVEADGRDPHLAPLTFASDRRRDRRLRVEGWQPVRVTSRDLGEGADELERDFRALLESGA